jgi:hypothetical protein
MSGAVYERNNEVTILRPAFLNLLHCSASDRRVDEYRSDFSARHVRHTDAASRAGIPSRNIISPPKEKTYKQKILDPAGSLQPVH